MNTTLLKCPCGRPSTHIVSGAHIVSGEGFTAERCGPCARKMEQLGWQIRQVVADENEEADDEHQQAP